MQIICTPRLQITERKRPPTQHHPWADYRLQISAALTSARGGEWQIEIADCRWQRGPRLVSKRGRLQVANANTGHGNTRKSTADCRLQIPGFNRVPSAWKIRKQNTDCTFQTSKAVQVSERWVWGALEISDNLLGDYMLGHAITTTPRVAGSVTSSSPLDVTSANQEPTLRR